MSMNATLVATHMWPEETMNMLNNLGKHLALHMARSKQLMEGMEYSCPVFRSTISQKTFYVSIA